jgi:hypothetical protein
MWPIEKGMEVDVGFVGSGSLGLGFVSISANYIPFHVGKFSEFQGTPLGGVGGVNLVIPGSGGGAVFYLDEVEHKGPYRLVGQ